MDVKQKEAIKSEIRELLRGGSVMWNNKPQKPIYSINYHKGDYTIYLKDLSIYNRVEHLKKKL